MIEANLENADESEISYYDEELHMYSKAISELKREYLSLQKSAENLPAYEDLIARSTNNKLLCLFATRKSI